MPRKIEFEPLGPPAGVRRQWQVQSTSFSANYKKNLRVDPVSASGLTMEGKEMCRKLSQILNELKRRYDRRQIRKILSRVDAIPMLDDRSADEILGYDEHGLPC